MIGVEGVPVRGADSRKGGREDGPRHRASVEIRCPLEDTRARERAELRVGDRGIRQARRGGVREVKPCEDYDSDREEGDLLRHCGLPSSRLSFPVEVSFDVGATSRAPRPRAKDWNSRVDYKPRPTARHGWKKS